MYYRLTVVNEIDLEISSVIERFIVLLTTILDTAWKRAPALLRL